MIQRLLSTEHAYQAEGHVLFSVDSFSDYGCLSGRDRADMLAGARVEVAAFKRDPADLYYGSHRPSIRLPGTAHGDAGARVGTSNARRWPPSIWGKP